MRNEKGKQVSGYQFPVSGKDKDNLQPGPW